VNVRKFKQRLKENNPEYFQKKEVKHNLILDPNYEKDLTEAIKVGDRCEVKESGFRGEVKYIGRVPDLNEGYFVGIQLDEPYGKNNGSFNGVPYFTCPNKYGIFARPSEINVGDFPELDIDEI
jgi:tubulin-folding cofactor B